jgi:D-alanine-D-alanine ligase-like ATP-grasp enzyme
MNRTVVCVECPDFMMRSLRRVAATEGDRLVLVGRGGDAAAYCDELIAIDVRESLPEAVRRVRERVGRPAAVLTTQEMFLTQAASLAAEFGLLRNPIPAVGTCRDKAAMKRRWVDAGVRTPRGAFFRSVGDLAGVDLVYPVIAKPSAGYASCGVRRLDSRAELDRHLRDVFLINSTVLAREGLDGLGFLVEEYLDGDEYAVDTIWFDGEPVCDGVLSKGSAPGPLYPDRLYDLDPVLDETCRRELLDLSHRAVAAIGIRHGATHTEIRYRGGVPYALETAGRPGAGGLFYRMFTEAYGIDFDRIFYLAQVCGSGAEFGRLVGPLVPAPPTGLHHFWYNLPHRGRGTISEIRGLADLAARPEIDTVHCHKKPGDLLYPLELSPDYFCSVVGRYQRRPAGPTLTELVRQLDDAVEVIY